MNSRRDIASVRFSIALVVSASVALLAWLARAFDRGGALAAAIVGTVVLSSTGWSGAVVLAAFFFPSALVGRITAARLPQAERRAEVRSARQVLANGGVGTLASLLETRYPGLGLWTLGVSLAAAAADTWATSLGRWSRRDPVLLGTSRRVPPGTSGGVSLLGTLAGMVGALLVSGTLFWTLNDPVFVGVAFALGSGGMFLDSALGTLAQARFRCPRCATLTERRWHECGTRTTLESGWRWLDNDAVNLLTTLVTALIGIAVWEIHPPGP